MYYSRGISTTDQEKTMPQDFEARIARAAREMSSSALVAYFGTVSGRLALEPKSRELVIEHRILGDVLQARLDA